MGDWGISEGSYGQLQHSGEHLPGLIREGAPLQEVIDMVLVLSIGVNPRSIFNHKAKNVGPISHTATKVVIVLQLRFH